MQIKFVTLDDEYMDWFQAQTGAGWRSDSRGFVAINAAGKPLGALMFESFTPTMCMVHIAIDNPLILRHGFLEEGFGYAYNYRDVKCLRAMLPENREKCIKFIKHLGFEEETRLEHGFQSGIDFVYYKLHKHDCRWHEEPACAA
jgi:hypothetical protein